MNAFEFSDLPDRIQHELLLIARLAAAMTPEQREAALHFTGDVAVKLALEAPTDDAPLVPAAEMLVALTSLLAEVRDRAAGPTEGGA